MPRYPRCLLPGYPHHIVQRGHDKRAVFYCDEDFHFYLSNLNEQLDALSIRLFSYCLMTNHVHLLVQPDIDGSDLSQLMRILAARQTRYTNRLGSRSGTLWDGRFKCSLVEREAYLLACCRYIELNPVKAFMVARPECYRWSSYQQRLGLCDEVIHLATLPLDVASYREFVTQDHDAENQLISTALSRNQLTGDERFRKEISNKIGRPLSTKARGRPAKTG